MSFQVGLIAVRNISAASRNSKASTSHPANPRKTANGVTGALLRSTSLPQKLWPGSHRLRWPRPPRTHYGSRLRLRYSDDLFHAILLRRAVVGNTWVAISCQIGDRPSPIIYLRQLRLMSRQDVLWVPSHVWTDFFRLATTRASLPSRCISIERKFQLGGNVHMTNPADNAHSAPGNKEAGRSRKKFNRELNRRHLIHPGSSGLRNPNDQGPC